jgi:hypothetical protein
MWFKNSDSGIWNKKEDVLSKTYYDSLKQDIEKTRLYSVYLSGSGYVAINSLDNIYDVINKRDNYNWFVGDGSSLYATGSTPTYYGKEIVTINTDEYYDKFAYEYGLTLKNKFTPTKLINDSIENFLEVDVATTENIININSYKPGLQIDGVLLKEGHRVLVKDQISYVNLPYNVDPTTYFSSTYSVVVNDVSFIRYSFPNSQNGIYKYTSKTLVRTSDLDTYENAHKYSVSVKMGDTWGLKQFHLIRLNTGYYPLYKNEDSVGFELKNNWILRNRVDYNNVYDINYNDIIKHSEQTYQHLGSTYYIPERMISVGEFGIIAVYQVGNLNIVENKYKVTLRSITQSERYYWISGDEGTLLRLSKLDMSIFKTPISNDFKSLMCVDFYDDMHGIVVGKFNAIYFTKDGGYTWKDISQPGFEALSYNSVVYTDFEHAYIGGDVGVFIQMEYINNEWIFYKRKISKFLDTDEPTEEYLLVDDINQLQYFKSSTWGLSYSTGSNTIPSYKEMIIIVTNGNNIVLYDKNNFVSEFDFLYLETKLDTTSVVDIKSVSPVSGTDLISIAADQVYQFNIDDYQYISTTSNNLTTSVTASVIYGTYSNRIFDYIGSELYLCGNSSELAYFGYTASPTTISLPDKYKSKLLILDYDIASKVNFFTDAQEYRLPQSATFSEPVGGFSLSASNGELGWIDYYRDSEKVLEYYGLSTSHTQLYPSLEFLPSLNMSFTASTSDITNSLSDIISLAPTINGGTSRYVAGTTSISGSTSSATIFMFKYLIIFKQDISCGWIEGHVIYFDSSILKARFVTSYTFDDGGDRYIYCYSDFDDTIINDIINIPPYEKITVTNLNRYDSLSSLSTNFNLHYWGDGYDLSLDDSNIFTLTPLLNNKTAYYNMAIDMRSLGGIHTIMQYQESFLNFGFKPTYNILDYLSNIDSSKFSSSKELFSMPKYEGIPCDIDGLTSSKVYIDTSKDTNKIIFSKELKFEWNSIWLNTFVDVFLNNRDYSTYRLLVMKKYYDYNNDYYVIEFHKKLEFDMNISITSIDIISRRRLDTISEDLMMLNNIQRSSYTNSIGIDNLQNELNFKFPTDSYCKILLSDKDIKESLSGILYVDDKYETALNIIRLEEEFTLDVTSLSSYEVIGIGSLLLITCSQSHGLMVGDSISLDYNPSYSNNLYFNGYQVVLGITGSYSFYTGRQGSTVPGIGKLTILRKDPFLNYQPVDIMDVGVDKEPKRAVVVTPDNIVLKDSKYYLQNVDFSNYRYELVDGLSVVDIHSKYPWVLEGMMSNAVIGEDKNGLVWYKGEWKFGRWFGGTWMSGTWVTGDWYGGTWNSYKVDYALLNININKSINQPGFSKWYNGRWFGGTWNNGSWYNGRLYDVNWNNGKWFNGIWNDGTWNNGSFMGGIWITGEWNGGVFNCNNRPSYWLDGNWYGGDFENGMWYNGQFLEKSTNVSRFGTKAFNSRTAIWHSGRFRGGEFHSYLNTDSDGNPISSEYNKYSIWNTGVWSGGDWYGGVAYAINFNGGNWYGGVIDEIQVIGLSVSTVPTPSGSSYSVNKFILNGLFRFNIGDDIWVVNDGNPTSYTSPYSIIGTVDNPGKYRVLLKEEIGNKTYIRVNSDLPYTSYGLTGVDNIDTGLRLTTIFRDSNWKQGVWTNGIFESGYFEGGVWYGGNFSSGANWGR